MVVEIRVEIGTLAAARREQPAAAPRGSAKRIDCIAREVGPARHVERAGRAREARDGERVPRREDLLVAAGMHARLACLEETPARAAKTRADVRRREVETLRDAVGRFGHARIPRVTLEVRRPVETVVRLGHDPLLVQYRGARLLARPHVEFAFAAFAVGIEARVERAVVRSHVAHEPSHDVAGNVRVAPLARHARRVRVEREERPVVVEHFLEVRNGPLGVDRVAAEAASELIVNAAVGHVVEGHAHDAKERLVAVARERAQAEVELERMRELGRSAESAVHGIERARKRLPRGVRALPQATVRVRPRARAPGGRRRGGGSAPRAGRPGRGMRPRSSVADREIPASHGARAWGNTCRRRRAHLRV